MQALERIELYVALKSLDRLAGLQGPRALAVPGFCRDFIDQAWTCLAGGPAPDCEGLEAAVDAVVVDEQDATSAQVISNLYLYAFSDLLLYFEQGEGQSLECVQASIIDLHDYLAAQAFLERAGISDGVVLSPSQEQQIAADPVYARERQLLETDRLHAQQLGNWQVVITMR
ncbi:hypothetical protein [Pseudomonas sessilinigenes]|uniref:Uncharacterized protein n=1 Tax=Pseudomonas sessilinigenes TaxID=658629 RepID=A0ABX8MFP4_9PSED|nr:hypothetical protein [Pseudomonas sessilinigenes]AZC24889.1 hypothetical protein C4K39_3216 [Pseudomonas sessilinigenes]QXH37934.1 hypothetical protein KSS89_16725 [Pseudomonas sessilinigenes]